MPAIRAVIFDMDGLLIDTEPKWWAAEIDIFGTLGLHLTVEDCRQTMGVRVSEVVDLRHRQHPWSGASREEVTRRIEDAVVRHVLEEGEALPGVYQAMETVRAAGLPIAIASSSSMALIEAVVKRLDLGKYIDIATSGSDVEWGKPHPAVYLTAARRLGVPPETCLALEDSPNGVLSAKEAGMYCIAVPDPHVRDDPRMGRADMQLASLEDFTPELLRHIQSAPMPVRTT